MPLTVKDILEKTFKRSFKGYDENEVDKFLDEIIDEIKALQSDNAALKEALDAEIARAKKTKDTEQAIMHTLVSAQKSAERILAEAVKKAEVIIDSAESTAKKRAENTVKELGDAQRRLEEVKNAAKVLARRFNDLLNNESASFEKIFRSYFGEIEGGINIKALEKLDEDITESLKGIEEPEKRPESRRHAAERPAMERTFTQEPERERPFTQEPLTERPERERPFTEEPVMGRPAAQEPVRERPERERPFTEEPLTERPPAEEPVKERPFMEQPVKEESFMEELFPEEPAAETTSPKPEAEKSFPDEIINADDYDLHFEPGKLMELTEINKVLSEIENSGEDILQDVYDTPETSDSKRKNDKRPSSYNSMYDDYSWLYGNEDKEEPGVNEPGIVFKDPKEKEELESLIDDIIDNKGI